MSLLLSADDLFNKLAHRILSRDGMQISYTSLRAATFVANNVSAIQLYSKTNDQ